MSQVRDDLKFPVIQFSACRISDLTCEYLVRR